MSTPADPVVITPAPVVSATERAVQALVDVIERSTKPEMIQTRQLLARRMALSGGVIPSRVPPPLNITEVGGYINLLERMRERDTLHQMVAAALGVAGPLAPDFGDPLASPPPVSFVSIANQRPPAGPGLAASPVSIRVRSDHLAGLSAALASIADRGCVLPLVNVPARLHPAGALAPDDLLALVGRVLMIVRASALVDPTTDAVVIGRPEPGAAGDALRVLLRPIGAAAPGVVPPPPASYYVVRPDVAGAGPVEAVQVLPLHDPAPALAGAGWMNSGSIKVHTLAAGTGWARLENITGLVPHVTRLRDELLTMYHVSELRASNVVAVMDHVWDGRQFVGP